MIPKQQKTLNAIDTVDFIGVVTAKLASAEFMIKLTKFPNKIPVPANQEVLVKAKLSGKIAAKSTGSNRISVYDTVFVAISYESAKQKTGIIIKKEKKFIPQTA